MQVPCTTLCSDPEVPLSHSRKSPDPWPHSHAAKLFNLSRRDGEKPSCGAAYQPALAAPVIFRFEEKVRGVAEIVPQAGPRPWHLSVHSAPAGVPSSYSGNAHPECGIPVLFRQDVGRLTGNNAENLTKWWLGQTSASQQFGLPAKCRSTGAEAGSLLSAVTK
ncbi:hypothetical protein C8R44DRAFT_861742 [Mycena epipterygia]|nr:hypothetical protein C8R44DRAFT_861742 [Mycena epipterygia]